MRLRILGIMIPIIIIVFFYGMAVGVYEYFPYEGLNQTKKIILNEGIDESVITSISFEKFNISSIIEIETIEDLNSKKTSLIKYIWKTDSLPSKLPDSVQKNFSDIRFENIENLEHIEKIEVSMDYTVCKNICVEHDINLNSNPYLFLPEKSNNKLIIYHQGHAGGFVLGKDTISHFLKEGYSVLAFSMPLVGDNNQPMVDLDRFGKIKLKDHDQLVLLETSDSQSPIKFFVEPIAVSLNYIDKNYNFESYYMVGISGGGWTTVLYSAIDERISQAYSVAGSYPIYLRYDAKNLGDYEQINPNLYKIANYLELYVMGSYGDDRKLVQIFNKYDPCCFDGELYQSYEDELKRKVSNLQKGKFKIYLDDSHKEHKISENALRIILKSMNEF